MGEMVVIRVGSNATLISPNTLLDKEFVDRVKMIARASRKLVRL